MPDKKIYDVILLAGGKGTRMREMTEDLPKPMVRIGNKPVLEHLINIFEKFEKFNFIICSGYLNEKINEYFDTWSNVKIVYTGDETNTGGRVKKVSEHLGDQFIVTYGDGLANINISKLIDFHESHNMTGTISVTNPVSRFGLVNFDDNKKVIDFKEKPKLEGFVNMGFMVFKKEFLKYLDNDSTLELEPVLKLSRDEQLSAYVHDGYFEPMDTYREYLQLNKHWQSGNPPWEDYE
tara:strand:+ start:5722 stop:6429 length:708 start_codon:yes stop_codon:yes gene_type:complete